MPKGFDECVEGGGRVRTISGPNKKMGLGKDQYCRVCYDDKGTHRGHTKTKERAKAVREGKKGG